jgi:hypothetical protein
MPRKRRAQGPEAAGPPREIPMTDLEADQEAERETAGHDEDVHAAGTPGGGTAVGGLAGTNVGDGSPENADLENALGAGIHDDSGEGEDEAPEAYAGPAGGAVGGTPAEGRASGGNVHRGIAPGGAGRGDSTIGSDPEGGG